MKKMVLPVLVKVFGWGRDGVERKVLTAIFKIPSVGKGAGRFILEIECVIKNLSPGGFASGVFPFASKKMNVVKMSSIA